MEFRWEVRAEQIDLRRWSEVCVAEQWRGNPSSRRSLWLLGAMLLCLALMLVLTSGAWWLGVLVLVSGAFGIWGTRKEAPRLLRQRLERLPAAHEPFSFVAAPTGTGSASPSGSDQVGWARYRSVAQRDDLIVLVSDAGLVRILPIACLTTDAPAAAVVDAIAGWIAEAHPVRSPV